jgi:hypothetical protein
MAERPITELPMPVPLTRHHGLLWLTFALLHAASPHLHLCNASASGPQALRSSGPPILELCPLRGSAAAYFFFALAGAAAFKGCSLRSSSAM